PLDDRRLGEFQERGFHHAPAAAPQYRRRDVAQIVVGLGLAAAVRHEQQCGFHTGILADNRRASAMLQETAEDTPMIGDRLGKWTIQQELGRGGMGRVYLAQEEGSERQAALKVLVADLALEPGFLQ